jgi:hypothetical protein
MIVCVLVVYSEDRPLPFRPFRNSKHRDLHDCFSAGRSGAPAAPRRPGGTSAPALRPHQMEAHEWLQYAEWAKSRSWPEDELVQASGAFRHVVHRNLTIAECRARDRATEKWRKLGRKLRGRVIKALAAESWVRKAREELEVARRRARLHAQRSSTDVALQVYLLQKPERDRQATLEEERCMLERVHASRKALVQVERARTRAIYQSAAEARRNLPAWYLQGNSRGGRLVQERQTPSAAPPRHVVTMSGHIRHRNRVSHAVTEVLTLGAPAAAAPRPEKLKPEPSMSNVVTLQYDRRAAAGTRRRVAS